MNVKRICISLHPLIHKKAKELRLNISRICEDALIEKIKEEDAK